MIGNFPPLRDRLCRPVIINEVSKADLAAVARCGLRNVENVLRMATLFADGARPDNGHLSAAAKDLYMSQKGGR